MSDVSKSLDADTAALLASLERGLEQAEAGQFAAVHTPADIAKRQAGRPLGSVTATRKEPVTLHLPPDVLARWRASGKGWQTRAAAPQDEQ